MHPSCANCEGAYGCHVSEICDVHVKDGTNCVCVEIAYACKKCRESYMAGLIVCVLMMCTCRKCSKSHMEFFFAGFYVLVRTCVSLYVL